MSFQSHQLRPKAIHYHLQLQLLLNYLYMQRVYIDVSGIVAAAWCNWRAREASETITWAIKWIIVHMSMRRGSISVCMSFEARV